jgi:hypothetical protein
MTLALDRQFTLATNDELFRGRVTASLTATAISKFNETPLADAVQQTQRLALANQVISDPRFRTGVFAWIVVTATALSDPENITDAQINTRVAAAFDQAARQLIPAT